MAEVGAEIERSRSVAQMWRTFYEVVLVPKGFPASSTVARADADTQAVVEMLRHGFYAGAASMFELVTRVSPEGISEDEGVEMLNRIDEELRAFAKSLAQPPGSEIH